MQRQSSNAEHFHTTTKKKKKKSNPGIHESFQKLQVGSNLLANTFSGAKEAKNPTTYTRDLKSQAAAAAVAGCVQGQLSPPRELGRGLAFQGSPSPPACPLSAGEVAQFFCSLLLEQENPIFSALIISNEKQEGCLKVRTAASFICISAGQYVF